MAVFAGQTSVSWEEGWQLNEPESVAVSPESAVAFAAGLGCDWHAEAGVVAGLDTVTVTELAAASEGHEQLSTLLAIEQLLDGVTEAHVSPPLVGRTSLRLTLVAAAAPALAGLLTTIWKLAWPFIGKLPPFGVFTTWSCAGGAI